MLYFLLLFFQADDLIESVNSERGGRHWIDQQPEPAKTPEEQRAAFQVEPGSRIELVAAEPLVFDPVWIDFDERGRMFVAEYADYPIGPVKEDGQPDPDARPLSKIVMLTDTDGDGRMDARTVFADHLNFCHSFLPVQNGILAAAQTELIFLKDTDGDNVADVREVWFDGFQPAHPQMQIGCPQWGMDNRIYLTYAPGNIRCRRPGFESDTTVKMPRQDMRFDPLTMKFEPVTGLGQFGNTIDNSGRRFFCTNRNPIMIEVIPHDAAQKYAWARSGRRHADVGPSGGDTRVFPMVAMKSNWLSHAGTHTSACGVTAYRGDLWNSDFQNSVFVCEPVGHLVTRSIVVRPADKVVPTAVRARQKADFLASTDTWFRPASLRTGPDGAIYLADMYRMWVEHPKFLPPDIAARIDWRAGEDRGRIWRIRPADDADGRRQLQTYHPPTTHEQRVALLTDPNGWRRDTVRRVLVETRAPVANDVAQRVNAANSENVNLSLLATLAGIDRKRLLNAARTIHVSAEMAAALDDPAVWLPENPADVPHDFHKSAFARFRTLLHRGKALGPNRLVDLILKDGSDPWFQPMLLACAQQHAGQILRSCADVAAIQGGKEGSQLSIDMAEQLAQAAAKSQNREQILGALQAIQVFQPRQPELAIATLTGLSAGLQASRSGTFRRFTDLTTSDDKQLRTAAGAAENLFSQARQTVFDEQRPAAERVAACHLLAETEPEELAALMSQLLKRPLPEPLADAVVETIGRKGTAPLFAALLTGWSRLPPTSRSRAIGVLQSRTESAKLLLAEIKAGRIPAGVVDIDQRLRLLQHKDADVRGLATEIYADVVSSDRKAVAEQYRSALTIPASAERGGAVFRRLCIKCHRIDGTGANVGPDISDTRNRSRDALLYDILDPNRRLDPQFTEYIVVLKDGRTISGLLVSDLDRQIVLRQPEGKETAIDRTDIEELTATSRSLMPVGLEKEISVQQMADLLEFLQNR